MNNKTLEYGWNFFFKFLVCEPFRVRLYSLNIYTFLLSFNFYLFFFQFKFKYHQITFLETNKTSKLRFECADKFYPVNLWIRVKKGATFVM